MKKKELTFRRVINYIHLWVGIPCAIILFIMCLSGTLYVFNREITQWVDSNKFTVAVPAGGQTLPVAQLIAAAEKEQKGWKVTTMLVPAEKNKAWTLALSPAKKNKKDAGKGKEVAGAENSVVVAGTEKMGKAAVGKMEEGASGGEKKGMPKGEAAEKKVKNLLVNPYTGTIQGDALTPSSAFFASVLQLHRWLLLENKEVGHVITGTAALLMILLQITGLMLWLPPKIKSWKKWNAWKQGFAVKRDAHWKRINFDLHKSLGFYAFIFITIMALTGPYFAFDWYKKGMAATLGTQIPKKNAAVDSTLHSAYPGYGIKAAPMETIFTNIAATYPYQGIMRVILPQDSLGVITVQKVNASELTAGGIDRMALDQYSGASMAIERFADKTTGAKIISLIRPIHAGELLGTFSKILYLIACLIATSLPVTGVLIWINKWRKTKKPAKSNTVTAKKHTQKIEEKRVMNV